MSAFWPTHGEQAMLHFLLPAPSVRRRFALAAAFFAAGLAFWAVAPLPWAAAGLVVVLAGHLPLWARTQTNAPGGATPAHEEVWAPVEPDWIDRITALERRGEKWDVTPWEASNPIGCGTLFGFVAGAFVLAVGVGAALGIDLVVRLLFGALPLFVPLWLSGIRSTWNVSELRRKGEALAAARLAAEPELRGDFEPVPLLALREGRRGKYPVDARLMLRPAREDGSGFLGVQLQVALNNVRGVDYPYLYAVVLGRPPFSPSAGEREARRGESMHLVTETGRSDGVDFLVVRQHADTRGGWHTDTAQIGDIVRAALARARAAWRAAGGEVAG